jgi:hypothetical protein
VPLKVVLGQKFKIDSKKKLKRILVGETMHFIFKGYAVMAVPLRQLKILSKNLF